MSEKPSCQQCQTWMEEAYLGELETELRPGLEAHLAQCNECRMAWGDYQALRRGMDILAETEGPSLRVQNQVLRAAEAKISGRGAKRAGLWSWLLRPATVAFATLLLVAGVGILGRQEWEKRKATEHAAPELAPQGTVDLLSPVEEAPKASAPLQQAPAAPQSPAKAKAMPTSVFKSPTPSEAKPANAAKTEADSFRAKDEAPAPAMDKLRQQEAPPPPPVPELEGRPRGAPALKSLAKPAAEPAPSGATKAASESGVGTGAPDATIPEAQRLMGGAASMQETDALKGDLKKEKQEKRAAPAPAQPEAEQNQAPAPVSDNEGTKETPERFRTLINSAKAKIKKQNFSGALEDLLAAQRLQDTQEVQDLILLCRSHPPFSDGIPVV